MTLEKMKQDLASIESQKLSKTAKEKALSEFYDKSKAEIKLNYNQMRKHILDNKDTLLAGKSKFVDNAIAQLYGKYNSIYGGKIDAINGKIQKASIELIVSNNEKEKQKIATIQKKKNNIVKPKLSESDLAEEEAKRDFKQTVSGIGESIKSGISAAGDFVSDIPGYVLDSYASAYGKIAKIPALFRENKESIKKGANSAAWNSYMLAGGWAREGIKVSGKETSRRSQIAFQEFGKAAFDAPNADKIIADLKAKDISIVTSNNFVFLENDKTGEKIKITLPGSGKLLASN